MKNKISKPVFEAIQELLRKGCARGEKGWESGADEEDTLTGDLCGALRTDGWITLSDDNGKLWKFRVTYKKFRGRGKDAEEKFFGSDGIIEIQIENVTNRIKVGKGLLFQAKKRSDSRRSKLQEQARAMEQIVSNGSAIFEYGPEKYFGFDSSQILSDSTAVGKIQLGDYLAEQFLPCYSGKLGMFYDANNRSIVYPDGSGSIVRKFAIVNHRLRIEVVNE